MGVSLLKRLIAFVSLDAEHRLIIELLAFGVVGMDVADVPLIKELLTLGVSLLKELIELVSMNDWCAKEDL